MPVQVSEPLLLRPLPVFDGHSRPVVRGPAASKYAQTLRITECGMKCTWTSTSPGRAELLPVKRTTSSSDRPEVRSRRASVLWSDVPGPSVRSHAARHGWRAFSTLVEDFLTSPDRELDLDLAVLEVHRQRDQRQGRTPWSCGSACSISRISASVACGVAAARGWSRCPRCTPGCAGVSQPDLAVAHAGEPRRPARRCPARRRLHLSADQDHASGPKDVVDRVVVAGLAVLRDQLLATFLGHTTTLRDVRGDEQQVKASAGRTGAA